MKLKLLFYFVCVCLGFEHDLHQYVFSFFFSFLVSVVSWLDYILTSGISATLRFQTELRNITYLATKYTYIANTPWYTNIRQDDVSFKGVSMLHLTLMKDKLLDFAVKPQDDHPPFLHYANIPLRASVPAGLRGTNIFAQWIFEGSASFSFLRVTRVYYTTEEQKPMQLISS